MNVIKSISLPSLIVLCIVTLFAKDNQSLKLHVLSECGYKSEYVHRGRKLGQSIFTTFTDFSYPTKHGKLHAGLRSRSELETSKTSGEIIASSFHRQFEASFDVLVPYVGYEHNITEKFSIYCGYLHFYYPKMNELNHSFYEASSHMLDVGLKENANEIFISAWANVIFRPTICVSYNFDFKEFTTVGHLFFKYDLDKIGLQHSYILADSYLGFDHAEKPYGVNWTNKFWDHNPIWGTINGHKGYIYGGTKLNLVYALNEHAKIKTGINFEANGNSGLSWTNFTGWGSRKGVKQMLWYSLAAECSF